MSYNCETSCHSYCGPRGLYGYTATGSGCRCECGDCRIGNGIPNRKPIRRKMKFNHSNASGYSNFNQECTQDSHCDFDALCSGHGGFYGGGCFDNMCVAECMDRVIGIENCPKPKPIMKRRRRR